VLSEAVRGRLPNPSFFALPGVKQARSYLRGFALRSPLCHLVGFRLTQVGSGSATMKHAQDLLTAFGL